MKNRRRRGSVLILSMFLLAVILLLAGIFLQMTVLNMMHITKSIEMERASWIARAGISQQIHDLREYWYLHQQEVREADFGGGSYRVGTASLIGRGFHNALIVSVGQYPKDSEELDINKIKKVCEAAEVSMNAPTDYMSYIQPKGNVIGISGGIMGPIHINGDGYMGGAWNGGSFNKSNKDYGPTISAGGYFYFQFDNYPTPWTFSEGDFDTTGTLFTATATFTAKTGSGPKWANGPYDPELHPTTVEHEDALGKKFSYDLLADKSSGGYMFKKVPKMNEITYDKFKPLVPDDWYLTAADQKGQKVVWRANENLGGGWMSGLGLTRATIGVAIGPVPWNFGNFEVNIPDNRDMTYVRHLYMDYRDPAAQAEDKGVYGLGVGQKGGPVSFSIDRIRRKMSMRYPMMWNYYRFPFPPGQGGALGGLIRGWKRIQEDKNSGGGAGAGVTVSHAPVVPDPDFTGMVLVSVRAGIGGSGGAGYDSNASSTETYTETNDLANAAPTAKVYQVDYTTGALTFGSCVGGIGIKGGYALPSPCQLRLVHTYYRDFIASYFYLSLDKVVKCIEIDLGKINEDNCPRDPKYPDDKDKYGVIYSELPVIVFGVPKVPVTIISEDDMYVSNINTDYLNPVDIENVKGYIKTGLVQDDSRAHPVGLVCKKVLWFDHTFSKWNDNSADGQAFFNFGALNGVMKYWEVNKVAMFSSYVYPYSAGSHFSTDGAGTLETAASTRLGQIGPNAWGANNWYYYPPRKYVGMSYKDCEQPAITAFAAQGGDQVYGGNLAPPFYYSSSFRTNPPPHLFTDAYMTNWTKIAKGEIQEDSATGEKYNKLFGDIFIEYLETVLARPEFEYTPEYAKALSEMINIVEGGEISTEVEEAQ